MIDTMIFTDKLKREYESPCQEVIEIQFHRLMDNSPLEDIEEGENYGWDDDDEGGN